MTKIYWLRAKSGKFNIRLKTRTFRLTGEWVAYSLTDYEQNVLMRQSAVEMTDINPYAPIDPKTIVTGIYLDSYDYIISNDKPFEFKVKFEPEDCEPDLSKLRASSSNMDLAKVETLNDSVIVTSKGIGTISVDVSFEKLRKTVRFRILPKPEFSEEHYSGIRYEPIKINIPGYLDNKDNKDLVEIFSDENIVYDRIDDTTIKVNYPGTIPLYAKINLSEPITIKTDVTITRDNKASTPEPPEPVEVPETAEEQSEEKSKETEPVEDSNTSEE